MIYVIQAQVTKPNGAWRASFGVPTFYLDSAIQGITDAAHAERIAQRMILDLMPEGSECRVAVAETSPSFRAVESL